MRLSRTPLLGSLIRAFFWEFPLMATLLLPPRPVAPRRPKNKMLVVRLDAIGDFLLFLDPLQKLRGIYAPPEWEITLMGNKLWGDLAAALGVADRYRFVDLQNFEINPFYRWRTLSWVKNAGFDVVLQGVYSRSYYRDDVIVRASEAPRRIGYRSDTHNSPQAWLARGNKFYTDLVELPNAGVTHTLLIHARLLAFLGGDGSLSLPTLPSLSHHAVGSSVRLNSPYFVMVPGGSARIRQWPCERFSRLAECIHVRTGYRPVILGGEKDRAVASQVSAAAPSLPWVDLCGRTSLLDALDTIRHAKCFIGNDTGLTHLATMARVPTLAIVGGAFPGRDFPYPESLAAHLMTIVNAPSCKGCGWHCDSLTDGRAKCVCDISLEAALSGMQWLWNHSSRS